jgi:glycyl-tRNA synthetase
VCLLFFKLLLFFFWGRNAERRSDVFRERDTTDQLIGPIDEVINIVVALVEGEMEWAEACRRLPKYDGVQAL